MTPNDITKQVTDWLERAEQLERIRATMIVNFGMENKHGLPKILTYEDVTDGSLRTEQIVIKVIEHLLANDGNNKSKSEAGIEIHFPHTPDRL